jgi:hypothetical protein
MTTTRPDTPQLPFVHRHKVSTRTRTVLIAAARYLGAFAVLAVGIDHIVEYYADYYRYVPTIGTLFLLDFIASLVVGLALLAPLGLIARGEADRLLTLLAAGGIALGAGTLAGLLISENGGLFGFMEPGYRSAIVLSMAFDIAAVGFLAGFLALRASRQTARRSQRLIPIHKEISQ